MKASRKTGATPINEAAYKGHTRMVQYCCNLSRKSILPTNTAIALWIMPSEWGTKRPLSSCWKSKRPEEDAGIFEKALAGAIEKMSQSLSKVFSDMEPMLTVRYRLAARRWIPPHSAGQRRWSASC